MTMEQIEFAVRDIATKAGILNDNTKHLKYTTFELLNLLEKHVVQQEERILKAKLIYKSMREEIEGYQKKENLFRVPESVKPEYRAEYMTKLRNGQLNVLDENGQSMGTVSDVLAGKRRGGE